MMSNKLIAIVLIAVFGVSGILVVKHFHDKKTAEEMAKLKEEANINPVIPETKPSNPSGASPFDKPNVDPLAERFAPTSAPKAPGESPAARGVTSIKFDTLEHNFGTIKQGDIVKTKFRFTNTGEVALLIAAATGSCGCTVPEWPKMPLKPNESGFIDVQFDSHGKSGELKKTINVSANTNPAITVLTIKSNVKADK
jgi:hypothetical protein